MWIRPVVTITERWERRDRSIRNGQAGKDEQRTFAINEKIFEVFLFVVSEVSTGRRCLSLALFFEVAKEKKFHCEKTNKKEAGFYIEPPLFSYYE
jgi:hypothetical protein